MLVKDVLKMTEEMPISEIALKHLNIGERKTREALRKAGCINRPGRRGWYLENEDKSVLEKEIYDFAKKAKVTTFKETIKSSNNKKNKQIKNFSIEGSKTENDKVLNNIVENNNIDISTNEEEPQRKRTSFDLDQNLKKELKVYAARKEKFEYEIVENAIKEYMIKYPVEV